MPVFASESDSGVLLCDDTDPTKYRVYLYMNLDQVFLSRNPYRRLFLLLLLLLLLDFWGMHSLHMGLIPHSLVLLAEQWAGVGGILLLVCSLPLLGLYRSPEAKSLLLRCSAILQAMLFLLVFFPFADLMSYLAAALQAPLVDAVLARADQHLGFDWLGCFHWIERHHQVARLLLMAYLSVKYQMLFLLFFTALAAPAGRLAEFIDLLVVSCLTAILISALFPARGAFYYYGESHTAATAWVSDFDRLRSGALTQINLNAMQGLVTMPSYHTCLAILFTYAMRGSRLCWPVALLNLLMIASTPYWGGHYLVDTLAGGGLAALLIMRTRHAGTSAAIAGYGMTTRCARHCGVRE